ncbi:DUF4870 domain-containing protein [Marisediminicola sp. LYQ134]|uniref:DUF4870 domain-containing protein n=1 Tax=Marisediminicola sp. LYQ134 TaxID=3391061 RepID=UPI003983D46A
MTISQPDPSAQSAAQSTPPSAAQPTPSAPHPAPPPTGSLYYGLGFLAFIGIPFLSVITAGIVMAAIYPSAKKKGALAAENARQAANWGYTLILLTVLTVGGHFALLFAFTRDEPVSGFYPLGIPITLFVVVCVVHLVVIIRGLVRAHHREVSTNRLAIPFIRAS